MTAEPPSREAHSDPTSREVLFGAFIGFYILSCSIAFVVALPFAALQVLNEQVLHRGQKWQDQFTPSGNWFVVSLLGVAAVIELGIIWYSPRLPPDLRVPPGWRTYAICVVGIILGLASMVVGVRLMQAIGDPYDHWYQGWG